MSRMTAYIGLGSNLGDRRRFIEDALGMMRETPGIEALKSTEPIETEALGKANDPKFLNAVAELKTTLPAEKLHHRLKEIEDALGRVRKEKWGPRTIDLDLLLFGDEIINSDTLVVPHTQMYLRSFELNGLRQLNAKVMHPVLKETVETLAGRLNGCDFMMKSDEPMLISIAGNIGAGKTTLAKNLASAMSCGVILERYDTNPFLAKVYGGNKDLALDSQLYFLTSRLEQLEPANMGKGRPAVADYVFDKELIYANVLLSREQLTLYEKIYTRLDGGICPAILIYLTDSPKQCLERIHQRNRPYEQQIQTGFLEQIDAGYKKLTAGWENSPVITLNEYDCRNQKSVDRLARQVEYYIGAPGKS